MPARYAHLPLTAFLAALDEWRARPVAAERPALEQALAALVEHTGFRGAAVLLDAPPLVPVELRAGTLAAQAGSAGATGAQIIDLPLVTEMTATPVGTIRIDGEGAIPHGPLELANAIATAIEVTRDRERARQAEAHLAALDEAVRGIASVLDLDRVLQPIVDRVRGLVHADYAALGIVNDEAIIELFITSGLSPGIASASTIRLADTGSWV